MKKQLVGACGRSWGSDRVVRDYMGPGFKVRAADVVSAAHVSWFGLSLRCELAVTGLKTGCIIENLLDDVRRKV